MYLLINPDNTVNFADDHPINESLNFEGLRLIELKEKSLDDVVGHVPPELAIWDDVEKEVNSDPVLESLKQQESQKRSEAQDKIKQHYPLWKQINILREGNADSISRMGKFIDACRTWSNDPTAQIDQLEKIIP